MNALVMYDRQTDTLWSQFLSRGVKGPLADVRLEIVPSLQTTWEQWLQLNPDTLLLDKRGRYVSDTYESYYRGGSAGILGESNKDKRLHRKELVLGVVVDEAVKAYPFGAMAEQGLINDSFSGNQVVVTFDPLSETGAIFDRNNEGRTLTFELLPRSDGGLRIMKDQQTGSTWALLTGRAVSGPLAGTALKQLPAHYSFWFAWSDFHPDTALYDGIGPQG